MLAMTRETFLSEVGRKSKIKNATAYTFGFQGEYNWKGCTRHDPIFLPGEGLIVRLDVHCLIFLSLLLDLISYFSNATWVVQNILL